ncbi:MAG: hypothetical protein COA86_06955 [Kangiella sp.]|nr:MAG: hypothetical protein COA86_06955 [Kangiella sp.]
MDALNRHISLKVKRLLETFPVVILGGCQCGKNPQLFDVLRGVVDSDRQRKGRFLLTGSASFELLKQVSEPLVGRVAILGQAPSKRKVQSLQNFIELHELPFGVVINNCERPNYITEKIIQIPFGCL